MILELFKQCVGAFAALIEITHADSDSNRERVSVRVHEAFMHPRSPTDKQRCHCFVRAKVESVLDFVASSQTLEAGFESLARAGRLVILGYRPSTVFKVEPTFRVDPLTVLSKGLEIHGSRYISMAEFVDSVKLVQQGKIKPVVTKTFPLEDAETAHQMILANKITGRAAMII
jgi:D-arabinose 1-dehydrogenase-like Zn-dependent alcohol dehydrogenase